MVGNLRKTRKSWARLSRILGRESDNTRVSGNFQVGGTGDAYFWVREVGDNPPLGGVPGGVPTQGRKTDNWEENLAVDGW